MESLERRALLTVGALDPTFGSAGLAMFPAFSGATHVRAQSDGKLLVATSGGLLRVNTNGSLDLAFGSSGIAHPGFAPVDVAVESSGKLLVTGTLNNRFAVAQLNTDGTLDTSFGTAGVATVRDIPSLRLQATALLLQSNGQIIIGGTEIDPYVTISPDNGYSTAILARLNANGTLDTTYGSGGIADIGDGYTAPVDLAFTTGGEVVATAPLVPRGQEPFTEIVRVSTTGASVTPLTDTNSDNTIYKSLFTDTSGRPVVYRALFGSSNIEAFTSTGTDTTFGDTGFAETPSNFVGMAPNSDGTFIVANSDSSLGHLVLRKYLANGSIDHTFGGIGAVAPALGPTGSQLTFTGPLLTLSNGDVVATAVNSRNQLVIAKVQVTSQGSTHPVVASTSFAAPALGSHYAYYTVNYNQGSAVLDASTVAPHGLTVLKTSPSTDLTVSEITANLVTTRGGNGTPITAVYAFRISGSGVSIADIGTYQFAIAGGAVTDINARGSVGTYGTTYSLYFSHSARRRPVVVTTATDPDPI